MRHRVFRRWLLPILIGICLSAEASAQPAEASRKQKSTSQAEEIARFFLEEPKTDSGYETGPLHIVYRDGTEFVKRLPPLKGSTRNGTVFNAVGLSGVQLAADRQTLGWTTNVENCCTSYSIPFNVVVFRHKQVLHTFDQGQMVWCWMFLGDGDQIAVVFGPTHGPEVGDYRRYDVTTGKLMSEVYGDANTQALASDAPEWAKRLEDHFHNH